MATSASLSVSIERPISTRRSGVYAAAAIGTNALLLSGAIGVSLFIGDEPDLYFAEGSIVTVWSALQMVAICAGCIWMYQLRRAALAGSSGGRSHLLWLLAAVGAGALSIDEAAGLHEWIDHRIHAFFGMHENPWTDRIDDTIVLGYGLLALWTAFLCRGEFIVLRSVKLHFVIAFGLFFAMVVMDLLTNSYSIQPEDAIQQAQFNRLRAWSVVVEDSLKLASEGMFIAALAGVFGTLKHANCEGTEFQ